MPKALRINQSREVFQPICRMQHFFFTELLILFRSAGWTSQRDTDSREHSVCTWFFSTSISSLLIHITVLQSSEGPWLIPSGH